MIMIKFILVVPTWLPLNRFLGSFLLNTLQPLIQIIRISGCNDCLSVPISGWWPGLLILKIFDFNFGPKTIVYSFSIVFSKESKIYCISDCLRLLKMRDSAKLECIVSSKGVEKLSRVPTKNDSANILKWSIMHIVDE